MAMYYVSPEGNDTWTGALPEANVSGTDGPFATLRRAREAVRQLRAAPGTAGAADPVGGPVAVRLRAGLYRLPETLQLRAEDSGTQGEPVTWEAAPGERAVLTGGVVVEGWEPYRGPIWRAAAPARMTWQGKPRQLFYKGTRQRRSRWPKQDPNNPLAGGWLIPEGCVDELEYLAFYYPAGALPRAWRKPWTGEANIYGGYGWCNNLIGIADVDRQRRIVRLSREPINEDQQPWYFPMRLGPSNRFCIENIFEELTEPGEWCFDPEERTIFFWPPGAPFDQTAVEVPALDCLVKLRDTQWVTLRGLEFTGTTTDDDYHRQGVQGIGAMLSMQGWKYCGEALHLRGTRHCVVERCRFRQVGGNAVYLERHNYRTAIRRNQISGAGANGVVLAGDRAFHPVFCEVTDNEIHDAGTLVNYVAGVFLGLSDGCLVAHNHLHDLPHHAVNLGSNGTGRNYVEYNEIRQVCRRIADTGAINSWMDVPFPWVEVNQERSGHVIRYNLIVDVPGCRVEDGRLVEDWTTRGIYLDDYTSNCLVLGNVVVRAGMGFQLHAGRHNVVENNVVVDCKVAIHGCDHPPLRPGNAHTAGMFRGNRFVRNIVSTTRPDALPYWFHRWTDLVMERCDENVFHQPQAPDCRIEWNDHPAGLQCSTYAEWQAMGFDGHSTLGDPLFVDAAKGDYRLQANSPALALGFVPIPLDRIGVRPETE